MKTVLKKIVLLLSQEIHWIAVDSDALPWQVEDLAERSPNTLAAIYW
jgi:hypothetical protein